MPLDRTNIRSMLGLRFRDAATEQPVTDGLRVTVQHGEGRGRPTRAVRTASGAYAVQGLPGLRPYERSATTDEQSDDSVPEESIAFLVSVEDARDRYVPVLLSVDLPYTPKDGDRGLYPVAEMSSENGNEVEPTCYLFSTVTRTVSPGQAVVYADLEEKGKSKPAAHAVLKVQRSPKNDESNENSSANENDRSEDDGHSTGEVRYGIADAQGRVAVQFPVPSVQLAELQGDAESEENGEPENANGGGRPLSTRSWEFDISVSYDPDTQSVPTEADRPLLSSVLDQKLGSFHDQPDSTTLRYGEPLVLTAAGRSALRVIPA